MSSYRVAHVKFSENGKSFLVNCHYSVKPGDFVIVRLDGKFTPLHKAQIVSVDYRHSLCTHSVVCLASEAEVYGQGHKGVSTETDLERFLVDFMRMRRCEVIYDASFGEMRNHPNWHTAYIIQDWQQVDDGWSNASKTLLVSDSGALLRSPDEPDRVTMKAGALLIRDRARYCIATIKPEDGNIYMRSAKRIEESLNADFDSQDTTRAQIKGIIGDGYLSDGEYV